MDLLAYLLGTSGAIRRGRGATVKEAADALSYSVPTIRRALQEMVLSGFVGASASRPAKYFVERDAWAPLLGFKARPDAKPPGASASSNAPYWEDWTTVVLYLDAIADLATDAAVVDAAPVVQSSRLRDLHDRSAPGLERAGVPLPDPAALSGERYLAAIGRYLDELGALVEGSERR